MLVKRLDGIFNPDCRRVIIRPHIPQNRDRIDRIINCVLSMSEVQVENIFRKVESNFFKRHKMFKKELLQNYSRVEKYIHDSKDMTLVRKLLIGAYFSMEYSNQSTAFFNPSIVEHYNQENLPDGCKRYIMSFRAVGEGHISSIEFREGIIDKYSNFYSSQCSNYAQKSELISLPDEDGGYLLRFPEGTEMSEKVIFPESCDDCNGIEDARFVRFQEDDGEIKYYATYTAYDGHNIQPKLIETKDFNTFKILPMYGKFSKNKGMALFPRKVNGKYMMITRVDAESLYLSTSDNIQTWDNGNLFRQPEYDWEYVQMGNCGSPIETDRGWVLLTHGVGPMREYSIGIILLDIENPSKIIGNIREPLIVCNQDEREGYVPNVVYSCGGMIHEQTLIIPYAMSDTCSGIATLPLGKLFEGVRSQNEDEIYAKST